MTYAQLKEAGFTDEEILKEAGFSDSEIKSHFGVQPTPPPIGSKGWLDNLRRKAEIGMGGVNVGAANLAGMPVDIVNKIFSLAGISTPTPVWGSEWIKQNFMNPPPKPQGFGEKVLGATAEQIPAGLAAIASGGTVPMASKFVGGAGLGGGIARTVFPESPVADFIGQLGGGLGALKGADLVKWLSQLGKGGGYKDLLNKVGGEMKPSLAGQQGQEWMEIGSQEAKTAGNQFYTQVMDEAKTIPVNKYPNTWDTIEKIKSSRDYKMLTLEDQGHVDKIINQVKSETSTPVKAGKPRQFTPEQQADLEKQVVEQFGIPAPPETSFDAAIGLKRTLAQQSWEARGTSKGRLIRSLKDAVLNDMEQAAKDAGKPQVVDNLANADRFWSENVFGEGKGALIQRFQKMSPEKLVDKLRTGNLNEIEAIRDTAGEQGFQNLKQGFVTDLAQRNENNAVRMAREIRKLNANRTEEMGKIFDPDEMQILQNMGNPGAIKVFMETHPKTKWLGSLLLRWGLIYPSATALGIRYLFPHVNPWGK
jgi:hypothetical protein